jgi:hypothetical protein
VFYGVTAYRAVKRDGISLIAWLWDI